MPASYAGIPWGCRVRRASLVCCVILTESRDTHKFIEEIKEKKSINPKDPRPRSRKNANFQRSLTQLRHACSIRPVPKAVLNYLRQDPSASTVSGALNLSRESNSIHLLSNCLYTLAHLISLSSNNQYGTENAHDAARIINDLIRNHSKSLHRCFAPGRTEATLACLSLLYACVSWNEGACAQVVITDLRWDQKTISRLLDTRQSVASRAATKAKSGPKQVAPKTFKLKGRLHEVDVRTLVLKLVMKIITTSELRPSLKLEFWRTKGLSAGLFRGLRSDGYHTIAFVLSGLWDGVVRKDGWIIDKEKTHDDSGVEKTYNSRWDIFDQAAITSLVQLLDDENLPSEDEGSDQTNCEPTAELVERFFHRLTDYISTFTPSSIFQSHANSRLPQYRILLNLIKSLSPTQSIRHQRLTLHILNRSPSLCPTLWRHAAPPIEPSCTINWISAIGLASKVASIRVTIPTSVKHRTILATDNKNTIINICSNLLAQCFPTPLGKTWFTKTLQHSNSLVVYCCLTLLVMGMKKAASITSQINQAIKQYDETTPISNLIEPFKSMGPWSNLLITFNEMLQSLLPDLQILIALLQKAPKATPSLQESKSNSAAPEVEMSDRSEVKTEDFSSDLISVHVLAFLRLCHDLIPNSIYHIRFDYAKLIPVYLKLNSSPHQTKEDTPVVLDPLVYLCQSRILHLVGYSASMNHMAPSSTLLTCLLFLSSSSRGPSSFSTNKTGHVPISVSEAARQTLKAVLKCNNPHLRDTPDVQEIQIWIDVLTELRSQGDCLPLISFLDDCIRACLRSPLKFVEVGQELMSTCRNLSDKPKISILYATLFSKTTAVLKAFKPDIKKTNKFELIDQLLKFHNLHLFGTLSSSHELSPMSLVINTSERLHQLFAPLESQGVKRKKGVLMVEFGNEPTCAHSSNSASQSQLYQEQNLRLLTRILEYENHTLTDDPTRCVDHPKIKTAFELILDCLGDEPNLTEKFLQDSDVRHVLQRAIKQDDTAPLFSDVLCRVFSKLDCVNPVHRELARSYADLVAETISSPDGDDIATVITQSCTRALCAICEFLEPSTQNGLLDAILTSTKIKSNTASSEDWDGLKKLIEIVVELARGESTSLVLGISSIKTLIAIACSETGESATRLLSIIVKQVPRFNAVSTKSQTEEKVLQVWRKLVSKTMREKSDGKSISSNMFKLLADLSRRDPQACASSIKWIATHTSEAVSWEGFYSLMLACVEVSTSESYKRSWPEQHDLSISQETINLHLPAMMSILFDDKISTDSSDLTEKRLQRITVSQLIQTLHLKCNVAFDSFFVQFATASELLPAYSETLNTLSMTQSEFIKSYVSRCLRWLVRRYAEDQELSKETEELTISLNNYLVSSPFSLPTHLVNPVLSAAIERWLSSNFVIRLVDTLARFTPLSDTDVLKHTRMIVENRQFKMLMNLGKIENEDTDQAHIIMSALVNLISTSPMVSVRTSLSTSLIVYYGGTRSMKDVLILKVFRIEDLCTQDHQFDQLFLSWKLPGQPVTSGLAYTESITHLDSDKMYLTCVEVLKSKPFKTHQDSYYDPDFLLVYLSHVMDQDSIPITSWVSIARANLLGLAMCALSSYSRAWRMLGDRCLTKAHEILKTVTHTDAAELLLPLEHFRQLHQVSDSTERSNSSVPSLITLLLTQSIYTFSAQTDSSLYSRFSKFLLQRAMIDMNDVPMLYTMLYSDSESPIEDQRWLLKFLRDGLNSTQDWKLMDRRQSFEILTSMVLSSGSRQSDPESRILLLELFDRATSHNQACIKLINQMSLITVLKKFNLSTLKEIEWVLNVLKNVIERIGLIYESSAIDCLNGIIEIILNVLNGLSFQGEREGLDDLKDRILKILHVSLINWKTWLKRYNLFQLDRIRGIIEMMVRGDGLIESLEILKQLRIRLMYLDDQSRLI
ncbi:ribosome 60S biogenesis N-terminal-domain-containing protein [Melampsora americana]|nr:ribosome 60S biogenesis N-terminal-domain-containing protein [Melampsora americana]